MTGARMVGAAAVITLAFGAPLSAQSRMPANAGQPMGGNTKPYVEKDIEYRGGMPGFTDKTKGSIMVTDSVTFQDKHDKRLFAVAMTSIDSIYGPNPNSHGPSIGKIILSNLNPTNKFHHGDDEQNAMTLFVHTDAGSQAVSFVTRNGPNFLINDIHLHGGPMQANINLPPGMRLPPGYGQSTSSASTSPPDTTAKKP